MNAPEIHKADGTSETGRSSGAGESPEEASDRLAEMVVHQQEKVDIQKRHSIEVIQHAQTTVDHAHEVIARAQDAVIRAEVGVSAARGIGRDACEHPGAACRMPEAEG